MNGTIFIKDRRVTLLIMGSDSKIPELTLELDSPQFKIEGNRVIITESTSEIIKK